MSRAPALALDIALALGLGAVALVAAGTAWTDPSGTHTIPTSVAAAPLDPVAWPGASFAAVRAIGAVALAAVTPSLVRADLRLHRLPNHSVLPVALAGLVAALVVVVTPGMAPAESRALAAAASATEPPGSIDPAPIVLTGLAIAAVFLVLNLLGGMGMGDVKLTVAFAFAAPGLSVVVLWPLFAFFAGGVVSTVLLLRARVRRVRTPKIAFGPYLLGGFWLAELLVASSAVLAQS